MGNVVLDESVVVRPGGSGMKWCGTLVRRGGGACGRLSHSRLFLSIVQSVLLMSPIFRLTPLLRLYGPVKPLPRVSVPQSITNSQLFPHNLTYLPRNHRRFVSQDNLTDVLLAKTLTSNKASEEFIRCTVLDKRGDVVYLSKDFKRLEFLKAHGLVPRDVRKITQVYTPYTANYINMEVVPSIVTRSQCILVNLLNVRAMIKADQVVLFDVGDHSDKAGLNETYAHDNLITELQSSLGHPTGGHLQLPYEFRALETMLTRIVEDLTTEMKVHSTSLQSLLEGLEDSIDSNTLRYLLIQSKKMTLFLRKASLVRGSIDEVLNDDDILNSLYLNESRTGVNHQEVELLLESYYVTLDEIVQKVQNLVSQTKSTNEIVNIILDSNRNEMMLLGIKFAVGLFSMAIALYVAATYGMNLENYIEETDYGFPLIISVSFLLLWIYLGISIRRLRKLLKITMTGYRTHD